MKIKEELKNRDITPRRRNILAQALEFTKRNKDCIVVILDPKKDDIIASYNDHYSAVNLRTKLLKFKVHIIRDIIKNKDLDRNINKLLQVLDGFLYNLAFIKDKRSDNKVNQKEIWLEKQKKLPSQKQLNQKQPLSQEPKKLLSTPLQKEIPCQNQESIQKKTMGKTIRSWLKGLRVKFQVGK